MKPPNRLILASMRGFYVSGEALAYAALRVGFGLTIMTHGVPKLLGQPHGSMADPLQGSTILIEKVLGLPFAPTLAMLIALLETFGGLAVALGLGTRLFAPMLAIQMAAICFALGPTYPWIDRGIEYPIILGLIAFFISMRGGAAFSCDRAIGKEL